MIEFIGYVTLVIGGMFLVGAVALKLGWLTFEWLIEKLGF